MGTLRRSVSVEAQQGIHAELDAELARLTPDDVDVRIWRSCGEEPPYMRFLSLRREPRFFASVMISALELKDNATAELVANRCEQAMERLHNPPPPPPELPPIPEGYAA